MKIGFSLPKIVCAQVAAMFFIPALSFAQSNFYQGKTIRIIHGRNAGGSGDLRVKAMIPFLQKYIRGAGWIDHRQHGGWHGGQRGAG
jgi:hypothetical protein